MKVSYHNWIDSARHLSLKYPIDFQVYAFGSFLVTYHLKLTILEKPEFEMIGYKKSVYLGDGSIGMFINSLVKSGKMKKLADTLSSPQQIWVCLSDCQNCGMNCSRFHTCCHVCVEKTDQHDFSDFADGEIFSFTMPASEWVLYEATDIQTAEKIHQLGVYEPVKEIGYKWNKNIRLHFDNEHECYDGSQWAVGKTYYFLLPVVPA